MSKAIFIYGTGALANKYLLALSLNFDVAGFVESAPNKTQHMGLTVFPVDSLSDKSFDLIVICSMYLDEITNILTKFKVANFKHVSQLESVVEHQKLLSKEQEKNQQKIMNLMQPPSLETKHIEGCRLLKDRSELLKFVPKSSVGVEIGVANGDYTEEILTIVKPKICHLVDIWGSDRYGQKRYKNVHGRFEKQFNDGTLIINRGLSNDCADDFDDNYFDWAYIDTDHSYKTTLEELRKYSQKVKDNGLIMGHDYAMGNWEKYFKYGVIEAVFQFCVEENYEFVYLAMELTQSFAIKKICPCSDKRY